jgi:3-hydroxyisobutyrate dehydrogenase-like beta-hydroxyacid dehydrogenase
MGRAMAARLAGAGLLHAVYNRTGTITNAQAQQLGVQACDTPADLAAACDIVITVIADDEALRQIYEGHAGLMETIRPGSLCIEMSTITPSFLTQLAAKLGALHCDLVDAPVSGSLALATAGRLTILAGGDSRLVERARPLFERLGRRTIHVGPLGSGAVMKLAINNIVYGLNQSVAESLVLAERAGIDRLVAYDAIAHSAAAAPFVHYRRRLFEQPESEPVQMTTALASKDLALIEALAADVGAHLPQAAVNRRMINESLAAGHADRDVTHVTEHLRGR